MKEYYQAYDDRYRRVHAEGLAWAPSEPTPAVLETMAEYGIDKTKRILEIGVGEGRDAALLLREGYDLMASDVSPEAIDYCKRMLPQFAERFFTLDAVCGTHEGRYDFIYAVAVIHMLVLDTHRKAFLRFIREHLTEDGIALVCAMGDGIREHQSDTATAFDLQKRLHRGSGRELTVASTSCRMVRQADLLAQCRAAGLYPVSYTVREDVPDFDKMMCVVLKKEDENEQISEYTHLHRS